MAKELTYEAIQKTFEEQPLFEDKTWQISPEAWPLTPVQVRELEQIGTACHEFYLAMDRLYRRSVEGRNLLRNRELKAPWVASYLDRGKPRLLVEHSRCQALEGRIPAVIRPDLLVTEDGYALTEIDSVPGGIGLTAFLNRLYATDGVDILGAGDAMLVHFYEALAAHTPNKSLPVIAIAVSDEAATYRPEMHWVAHELQRRGKRVYCVHPDDLMPLGDTLNIPIDGNPERVDILYRFFELFDLGNVPIAQSLLEQGAASTVIVTPPMRPFQEEKLALALFHHHQLEDFWRENLSKRSFRTLGKVIPRSWIVDPVDLPPNAVLDAPTVGGKPIWKWEQLGEASQKERALILKISGFHEEAWGARSVVLGNDVSKEQWMMALRESLRRADRNLSILQEYRKPTRLQHPVYKDKDTLAPQEGRLRLTPFYFVEGDEAKLSGCLATFCPPDKKIIHGMRDAAMLPCQIREEAAKEEG